MASDSFSKPVVYVHTNAQQLIAAKVSMHSLRSRSPNSDKFDVQIIHLEDFPALYARDGSAYLRGGNKAIYGIADLQSFTLTRFLPPQLMNFVGRALVVDPDVFAIGDVYELLTREMGKNAILCREISPADGRPPYYASSVMLLNCERLTHWKWDAQVEEMFALKRDYRKWINLELEDPSTIGLIEKEWNDFDTLTPETKLLHNTSRITQPWKTGLPVDFTKDPPGAPSKSLSPKALVRRLRRPLVARVSQSTFEQHPDPSQEALFFGLLRESIEGGLLTEDDLKHAIERSHLRPDALELMRASASR